MIPGYLDLQLTDKLVEFIEAINFSALNENELELLFSESLTRDPVSRQIQDFMKKFIKDW